VMAKTAPRNPRSSRWSAGVEHRLLSPEEGKVGVCHARAHARLSANTSKEAIEHALIPPLYRAFPTSAANT
jgi:hypothetical protein